MNSHSLFARFFGRLARPQAQPWRTSGRRRASSGESGYAFLMVMGMVILMAILAQEVLQNMYTQGRRAREDEMIWRGNQYVRAIRLYYRKTGHYPLSIDDLKSGVAELHFLRSAAYKDPTDKDQDGAWRFIYVNGAGQIIGSVKYANLTQMALMDLNGGKIPVGATLGSMGVPAASLASGVTGTGGGSSAGASTLTQQGAAPGSSSGASASGSAAGGGGPVSTPGQGASSDQSSSATPSSDQLVNPLSLLKPTGPVDGPVIGGMLTGVGGGTETDAQGIKVIHGEKKYKEWEFIWNPLEDQARAIQAGLGALGQPTGTGGAAPPGSSNAFGNPGSMSPGFGGAVVPPTTTQPQPQN